MVPKRKIEAEAAPAASRSRPIVVDAEGGAPGHGVVASPARELQAQIETAYASAGAFPEPEVRRWPASVRLATLAGLVVLSWSAVLAGGWASVRTVERLAGGGVTPAPATFRR